MYLPSARFVIPSPLAGTYCSPPLTGRRGFAPDLLAGLPSMRGCAFFRSRIDGPRPRCSLFPPGTHDLRPVDEEHVAWGRRATGAFVPSCALFRSHRVGLEVQDLALFGAVGHRPEEP